MAVKICPSCLKNNTKKIGIRRGVQRYKCNDCNKKFQSKRRPKTSKKLFLHPQVTTLKIA